MNHFIPPAFPEDGDSCPVCAGRKCLDSAFESVSNAINTLTHELFDMPGLTGVEADLYLSFLNRLAIVHGDYRVSLAVNLSIWFSAERFGRAGKVPDLLQAADQYRNQGELSINEFKLAWQELRSVLLTDQEGSNRFESSLSLLDAALVEWQNASTLFWGACDDWAEKRHAETFKIV